MKRIVALVAVLTLIMTMFAFSTAALASYTVYSACPNGKPLNVRTGPGKNYPTNGSYWYGEYFEVNGDVGNGWLQLSDGSGYVQASLTSRTDPGEYDPSKYQKKESTDSGSSLNGIFKQARLVTPYNITLKGVRASGSANIRWAPSKQSTLQKACAPGKEMRVIAELGSDWFQVEDPLTGSVGFVNKAYVNK